MSMLIIRQRMRKVLNKEPVDRIPFEFDFTPPLYEVFKVKTGAEDVAEYFDFDMRYVEIKPNINKKDISAYLPDLPPEAHVNEWGVAELPGSVFHFVKMLHPLANLKTPKELDRYPFPDFTPEERHAHMDIQVKHLKESGYFVVAPGVNKGIGVFENAWYMRGLENLLIDFITNPSLAEALLDKVLEVECYLARRYAEAGVDVINFFDDVGTQRGMLMDPNLWRKFLKPRLAKLIATARKVNPNVEVYYHSDGKIEPIIPDLIEVGVTILNPVQPECMNPEFIKREYGRDLTLWGTIGTQTTMPFGTPEEVKDTVRQRREDLGKNGGLVLAPTHLLEPEVPWENVLAFVEAAREEIN